jgi:lipopolysaccharide transport system ATP-binding protein
MEKKLAIKVENLSKAYQLGQIGTGTISRDIERFWTTKIRGKEDPFLKIGQSNDRTVKDESDIVWSLKDINFEIEQGDAVGIIGRNGAGKSTLLKLLSRVTAPTTGNIKVKGRIASLLEVGTGFHPELTGRENIYLNGAILGMRKKEITRKFDEIVDFSGVERYIDTPVKRYSSGMYVRLAFAVAAHLESEILIVDEVLAVGDAEFQKKCLGKMGDVSKGDGRTVLFVSHNMSAIKELCAQSILLKNGEIEKVGSTRKIIDSYITQTNSLSNNFLNFNEDIKIRRGNGEIKFTNIRINNGENSQDPTLDNVIYISLKMIKNIEELYFCLQIKNSEDNTVLFNSKLIEINKSKFSDKGILNFQIKIDSDLFRVGIFPLYFWVGKKGGLLGDNYAYDIIDSLFYLNFVSDLNVNELGYDSQDPNSCLNIKLNLKYNE